MKKVISLLGFVFIGFSLYAQKPGKAYYNYKWGILGGTDTYFVPSDSGYYLIRNFKGLLAFDSFDTLKSINGNFSNKDIEAKFSEKKLVLKHVNGEGKPLKLKVKDYDQCNSFINQNVNLTYAWILKNKTENIARASLGDNNSQWLNRRKHKTEPYNSEIYRSKNSVFSKTCFSQFKLEADSVYKNNLVFIEKLKASSKK